MSLAYTPAVDSSPFDAALLDLAHSQRTIYEHTRMSGENRRRLKPLPVDRADSCSDALESDYAHNMARHFEEPPLHPPFRRATSQPVPGHERLLDAALLLAAHSERSIYEHSRLSGEHRHHKTLPTDFTAEQSDHCTDATDQSYVHAMARYFAKDYTSRL